MLSNLFVVATLAYGVLAQGKGGAPEQIQLLPTKMQPMTPPRLIDESPHKKECPAGFQFIGKQCSKTITAPIEILCPPETIKLDGECVKYVGKYKECPNGYIESNGGCLKENIAEPQPVCPPGFGLNAAYECTKKLTLEEVKECPAGAVIKGDNCVKLSLEAPVFVCPQGYELIGRKCQLESTFDCTPVRVPSTIPEETKMQQTRLRVPSKGKEETVYRLPVSAPIVEEYTIKETCKRITREDAHPICIDNATFNGKMCELDVIVPEIRRPGGHRSLVVPATFICPDDYTELNENNECIETEFVPPELNCPGTTTDLGDKCGIFSAPKSVCPKGFYLDEQVCVKTIYAAPIVQYTLTYTCTGKDCGHNNGF